MELHLKHYCRRYNGFIIQWSFSIVQYQLVLTDFLNIFPTLCPQIIGFSWFGWAVSQQTLEGPRPFLNKSSKFCKLVKNFVPPKILLVFRDASKIWRPGAGKRQGLLRLT